ncbi:amidase [Rhizobium oryzicola]|uniref:Indoleacetamide hydrolase n=1 Tax=Rhizobium oryzicola TaxID=1232668 RepID=A0ABT8SXS4_9HYPH|nr:amidase [Rhizobium oryzicola]MDO1583260.1 amidase [Rhizobium oryzicola]
MYKDNIVPANEATHVAKADRTSNAGDLWSWSAEDLAAAIKRKDITSREATLSALERISDVNPKINAVAEVLAEEALRAADAADAAVQRGEHLAILHGVPVTTKINVDLAGHATTNGVLAFKDKLAATDSPPVKNFRRSGAVIIGRTNTPSFSFRWFTENDLHGRTYNPWDKAHTPGGSSGGAASAVASGIGALAHGNDIAGSVRYPAYACGVLGLRPTFGRIPSIAEYGRGVTAAIMAVEGVLGRSIKDVSIGLEAMVFPDARDPWYVPAPLSFAGADAPCKVALFSGNATYKPDASVAAALKNAAEALTAAGYVVEEIELPDFAEGQDLWSQLVINEWRDTLGAAAMQLGDDRIKRKFQDWSDLVPRISVTEFSAAMCVRERIAIAWQHLLETHPVILMPNSWELPMMLDRDQGGLDAIREILHIQSPMLLPALLGLPGLSVPTGLSNGVPAGVQIVAGRFREDQCLAAGRVIEAAHPMQTPIDPRGF